MFELRKLTLKEFHNKVERLSKTELIRQLYFSLNTERAIPWKDYDPENPPASGKSYLISDGQYVDVAFYDDDLWFVPDMSSIDGSYAVTHYAEINLPNQREDET